jgi:hypothetical protein
MEVVPEDIPKDKSYNPVNLPKPTSVERKQRHFLDFQGLWLDGDYNNAFLNKRCLCGCTLRMHLVNEIDISKFEICLTKHCFCERFVEPGYTVIVPKKDGKIPKKEEEWVEIPKEVLPLVRVAPYNEEISEFIL